jgi:rRNA maturation endonuclease Nob1
MKITSIIIEGQVPTVRHCRACGANVRFMGKVPKFCTSCGHKFIERPEYISREETAEILEAHYTRLEKEEN